MKVTQLQDLKKYAEGTVVQLSEFVTGQPLVVRVKRISLISLVRAGKIPNKLYNTCMILFGIQAKHEKATMDTVKENAEVMEIIAKECLLEPTFEDFEAAGIKLTDEQLLDIYTFVQSGVTELNSFRAEQEDTDSYSDGEGVQ